MFASLFLEDEKNSDNRFSPSETTFIGKHIFGIWAKSDGIKLMRTPKMAWKPQKSQFFAFYLTNRQKKSTALLSVENLLLKRKKLPIEQA